MNPTIERLKLAMAEEVYLSNLSKKIKQNDTSLQADYVKLCIHKFCSMLEDSITESMDFKTKLFIKGDTMQDLMTEPIYETAEAAEPLQIAQELAYTSNIRSFDNLAFVDIETDGLSFETNHILQVAVITPTCTGLLKKWCSFIRPDSYTSTHSNNAYHINGIGWEQLRTAPNVYTTLSQVSKLLQGKIVIGYNSQKFDLPFLKHHCQMNDIPLNIDSSLDLYAATWHSRQSKLQDALNLFNLHNLKPHDALGDTLPLVGLMNQLVRKGEIPDNDYELHELEGKIWRKIPILETCDNNQGLLTPPGSQPLKRKNSADLIHGSSRSFR